MFAPGKGGNTLVAVNAAGEAAGLRPGMRLSDALAIHPPLLARRQEPVAEQAEIKQLARACRRYAPWTGIDQPDGVWINITGAAHLHGGEAPLLRSVAARFSAAGYAMRAAIAGTHGAAWGAARFGREPLTIIDAGTEAERLSALSVRALGIAAETANLLEQLGLKQIGQLLALSRASLRARFGVELAARLDHILGRQTSGLATLACEPVYARRHDFAEPVTTAAALESAARRLIEQLTTQLQADAKGARLYVLTAFTTQDAYIDVRLPLARPCNEASHIARLLHERCTALEGRFSDSEAYDALLLRAHRIEPLAASQAELAASPRDSGNGQLDALLDRLTARLGDNAVRRFASTASHDPERASISVPATTKATHTASAHAPRRPLLLLPRAEPIRVIAELPHYPPRRFTWRRARLHHVVSAEGPERIAAEWWREAAAAIPLRDYFILENAEGCRFWVYREGVYGHGASAPRWYLHGLFA